MRPFWFRRTVEDGSVKVYIVSDKTAATQATLRVRLMDFDGKSFWKRNKPLMFLRFPARSISTWPLKKLTDAGAADTSRVFVVADLQTGGAADYVMNGNEISRNLIYLAPVKQIQLKPATLKVEATGEKGSYEMRISAAVLARDVYLSFGNLDVKVSDNYLRPSSRRNDRDHSHQRCDFGRHQSADEGDLANGCFWPAAGASGAQRRKVRPSSARKAKRPDQNDPALRVCLHSETRE